MVQKSTCSSCKIVLKFTWVLFVFGIVFSCHIYPDNYEDLSIIYDDYALENEGLYNLQSGSGNGIADFYSDEKEVGELLHMIFMSYILQVIGTHFHFLIK